MKKHAFRQLLGYLKPYKLEVILATLSSIANKLCDIVPEILIGIAIDVIINQQHSTIARFIGIIDPFNQLYFVAGLTAILWIGESIFEYCYLVLWRSLAQNVQHDMRVQAYAHLQTLDSEYFEDKTTGGLVSVLNDDINQLEQFLSEGPNTIIQLVINILVMGGIFAYISPTIAFLTLLPVPVVLAIAYYFQHKLAALYEHVRERVSLLGGHISSRLIGISTIKSYTTEHFEVECLKKESIAYKNAFHKASRVNAAYIPIVRMGILTGFILSMVVGGQLALQGSLGISFYSVLVFLTQRFLWPFTTLTTITDLYERAIASARRVFDIIDHKAKIKSGTITLIPQKVAGGLSFKNISFSYPNGKKVFENLTLEIPAKKTVAFVGTTGSGKSTIIKLLLRFYEKASGQILLDNNPLETLDIKSLRSAIGFVSQDVYLIDGTVAQNIAYGQTGISQEAIIQAAKAADAHNFIMQLPHGYDSLVGENGKNLSGGQRQRISIARAILKNPQILIFDEATSALDNETEASIQHSMKELSRDHTMVIIAHRLSTVRHANTIFVLEHGKIIESGTHEELIAREGIYSNLWNIQTGAM